MSTVSLKAGDTLSLPVLYSDSAGTPINLTGYTVAAQIRSADGSDLIGSLTATLANQGSSPGVVTLSATAAATALWTTGTFVCDIKFTVSGTVSRSSTFTVIVDRAVTA